MPRPRVDAIGPQRRSVGVTATAWKTSAGAAARVPVAMASNLTSTLKDLKARGVFVLGLDGGGDVSLPELALAAEPVVLVTGSEGKGLSRLVTEQCDAVVSIPIEASTEMRYHRANLFDVLDRSAARSYTHYTLCDAPDWMPEATQRRLLNGILRTSRDGAIVLYRSVEDECMVERLGFARRFVPLRDRTEQATHADRSRQYRAVRFYQVAH